MTLTIETITIEDIKTSDAVTLNTFAESLQADSAALWWFMNLVVKHCNRTVVSFIFCKLGERDRLAA